MMRKRGGKVHHTKGAHPDAEEDRNLIKQVLDDEGLIRRARGGGITMRAGSDTGIGRLEKAEAWERHGDKSAPVVASKKGNAAS